MSTVAKSAVGVTAVMIIGYILSFAKEAIIANYYGVSSATDAYSIAIQVPVLLFAFISVAIRSVVIPIYSDIYYKESQEKANVYANRFLSVTILISFLGIILGEIFAGGLIYIFAPGFSPQTHELAVDLLRLTFPAAFFTVVINVFTAILNVHKKFIAPSFAVYFLNIGLIVSIILLHSEYGISAACIGQVVGEVLSFIFVILIARKVYKYKFEWNIHDDSIKKTAKMVLPVLWTISISEINAIVNRVVGSFLVVGSISALSYSGKIDTMMMSLFVSALTTIVYPMYAESAAKNNHKQLSSRANLTLSIFSLFIIPLMCGVFIYKREIVEIVFARGSFDASAVEVTQGVLGFYTIGLLFMSFRSTITNIFHSLKDTKTPAVNATVGAVLNIVLNISFAYFMGVNGLALSRSIVAAYINISLLIALTQKHKEINLHDLLCNLKAIIPSAAIMSMGVYAFNHMTDFDTSIVRLLAGALVGVVLYLICITIFKVPILKSLKERLPKLK